MENSPNGVTRQGTGWGVSASQVFGAYGHNRIPLDGMGQSDNRVRFFHLAFWLADASARFTSSFFEIFAEISNLLNTRFIDAGSAMQPGRWFKAGVVVSL